MKDKNIKYRENSKNFPSKSKSCTKEQDSDCYYNSDNEVKCCRKES